MVLFFYMFSAVSFIPEPVSFDMSRRLNAAVYRKPRRVLLYLLKDMFWK